MCEPGHPGTNDFAPGLEGRRQAAALLPSKTRRLPGKKGRHPAVAIGAEVEGREEEGEAKAEAGRSTEVGAGAKQKARCLGKMLG